MVKKITIWMILGIFLFPALTFAEKNIANGILEDETFHFSAPDDKYILTGKVTITNDSKETLENVQLIMNAPNDIRFPIDYEDPIEIGAIKANETITENILVEMYASNLGNEHTLTIDIFADDQDEQSTQVGTVEGDVDLAIMKKNYTEVDATVEGSVTEDEEGNHSLDITIAGTNHSIYPFKEDDEIYLGFELPYNLELDTDRAPKGMHYSIAGESGGIVVVQIVSDAQSDFSTEYSIPFKGELSAKLVQNTRKRILMNQRRPGDYNEFRQSGIIEGQTDLDYSLLIPNDEDNGNNDSNNEDRHDNALSETTPQTDEQEKSNFFDTSFYVGVLVGALIALFICLIVILLNKKRE